MNNRPNFIVAAALAWMMIIGFVLFTDGGQTISAKAIQSEGAMVVDPSAIDGGEDGLSAEGNPPALLYTGGRKPEKADVPLYLDPAVIEAKEAAKAGEEAAKKAAKAAEAAAAAESAVIQAAAAPPMLANTSADSAAFAAPYDNYVLTQGPHGDWYGHMAIDLAAGNGAVIKSPINGSVTQLFIDQWGNPNLIIENDTYTVTMMHGIYTVNIGDPLLIGQPVGTESNQGYTLDFRGNVCAGRDCGYHTHLNVFDKRIASNIDPTALLGR